MIILSIGWHTNQTFSRSEKKYCSCDKACQFSALWGTPRQNYLENLAVDDKFINKRVRIFTHQTMCLKRAEKKTLLGRHTKVVTCLLNKYRSNHLRCSFKKAVLLITSHYSQDEQDNTCVEVSF